jgi:hypothetical protein
LCKENKIKLKKVHRLVAEAFISNLENKSEVNHINGTKTDNRVDNLEFCTRSENQIHAYKNNLQKPKKSSNNILSKKVIQRNLQGGYIKTWNCVMDIERVLGIKKQYISACCLGKIKTSHNYIWEYKDTQ